MGKLMKYFCVLLISVLMLNSPISAFTLIDANILESEESSSNDNRNLLLVEDEFTNSYDDFGDNTDDFLKSGRIPDPLPDPITNSVPEPGTLLLISIGLAGVIALKKRL